MKVSRYYTVLREADSFRYDEKVMTPEKAKEFLDNVVSLSNLDREHVVVIHMNAKGEPIGFETVAIGGQTACTLEMKYLFKSAILNNAYAILMAHNHPTGYVQPSQEDKEVTKRLIDCGKILGIQVVDSIIVGANNVFSFRKESNLFSNF